MLIRRIDPEEYAALGSITLAAYRHLNGDQPLGPYEEELVDVRSRALDSEVYVALDDEGHLVGGVTYVPDAHRAMAEFDDPGAAGIRMLSVDPAFEGRGAGRALVSTCVERAREQRCARLILHSAPMMTRAQSLYVRMGFERAPALDRFIAEEVDAAGEVLHLKAFTLAL